MKNFGFPFCVVLAVSLARGLELETPKELTVSFFHPIQAIQSYLLGKLHTLLDDDGTNARNILADIDAKIDGASETINDITVTLEKNNIAMSAVPHSKFVNLKKGYEIFNIWHSEGDNMRNKYTLCVKNLKPEVERSRRTDFITSVSLTSFSKLYNSIAVCTRVEGLSGLLKSVMCTARLGICVLWKTLTIPNQPLYVPITHRVTQLNYELKSPESCINTDAPTPEELSDFQFRGRTIVYEAIIAE